MLDRTTIQLNFHAPHSTTAITQSPEQLQTHSIQERDKIRDSLSKLPYTVTTKGRDFSSQSRRRKDRAEAIKILVTPDKITGTRIVARIECNPILNHRQNFDLSSKATDYNGKKNFLTKGAAQNKDVTYTQARWVQSLISEVSRSVFNLVPLAQKKYAKIDNLEITTDIYDIPFKSLHAKYSLLVRDKREKADSNTLSSLGTHKDCQLSLYKKTDDIVRLELKVSNKIIKAHTSSFSNSFLNDDGDGFKRIVDELVEHYFDEEFCSVFNHDDISSQNSNPSYSVTPNTESLESSDDTESNVKKWTNLLKRIIPNLAYDIAKVYCSVGQINFGDKWKHARSKLKKSNLIVDCGKGIYKFKSFENCTDIINTIISCEQTGKTKSINLKTYAEIEKTVTGLLTHVDTLTLDQRLCCLAFYIERGLAQSEVALRSNSETPKN